MDKIECKEKNPATDFSAQFLEVTLTSSFLYRLSGNSTAARSDGEHRGRVSLPEPEGS